MATGLPVSTGSGAAVDGKHLVFPLGKYATVFQAELYALFVTICHLITIVAGDKQIWLFTDSKESIQALDSHYISSKLVYEIRKKLDELCALGVVHIAWVPGHFNIDGNEEADELARMASASRSMGPEPVLPLSGSFFFRIVDASIKYEIVDAWFQERICRQTKALLPTPEVKWSSYLRKINKPRLRQVIQAITGHSVLNEHLVRMKLRDNSACTRCAAPETVEHFLCSCVRWNINFRNKIYGAAQLDVNSVTQEGIHKLVRYIIETRRLI